jgi:hypothetical protein
VSAVVDISPPGVPNAFPLSPTAAATSTATASSNSSNGGGGGGGSRRDAARELYEAGRHAELEGELARARACYLRSSALGHPAAVFIAGRMLEMGIGGPPLLQRVGLSLSLALLSSPREPLSVTHTTHLTQHVQLCSQIICSCDLSPHYTLYALPS